MNRLTEIQRWLRSPLEQTGFEEVYLPAVELYVTRPHWLAFYLAVFAERGLIHKTFLEQAAGIEQEVLTVRVPGAVHQCLKVEAHERRTSLNRLCLSKLLQPLGAQPVRRCRVCGCTDDRACEGGCFWVEADLCSRCAGPGAA